VKEELKMSVDNVCTPQFQSIVAMLKLIYNILRIAIPIALLIFGTIDLGKAVMAGDEKEIKSATSLLIKRVIAAVAVFLLFTIVYTVTGWVGGSDWQACWKKANTITTNW